MRDPNPEESLDAEGIPGDLFDPPPGIDIETGLEGLIAPRDHSIAAGSDPAYPVTAAENGRPESVAARADRELPEVGEAPRANRRQAMAVATSDKGYLLPDVGEHLEDVEDEAYAEEGEAEGDRALSPEEAAMHLVGEDAADDLDPAVERAQYLEP